MVIVPRDGWGARSPIAIEPMSNPVPYVIIHHSYSPPACSTTDNCITAMQTMQYMHQIENKWNDIGYHFAVGGDGNAYEGRGWSIVGAHAPKYNNISIGICIIGDWTDELPPQNQLDAVHGLIAKGVDLGMIQDDFKLLGHRQVRETECPGNKLFEEIQTWDHFSLFPTTRKESGNEQNDGFKTDNFFFC